MGNSVISQLGNTPIRSNQDLRQRLAPKHSAGRGRWVDVCGLFIPKSEIDRITRMIGHGEVTSLNQLEQIWKQLHADYYKMEWTWVIEQMNYWWGKEVDELTLEDVTAIIDRWLDSVTRLDNMLLDDAGKEYSLKSRTGFGIDDPEVEADGDFVSVRGEFEADPFVAMVREHIADKSLLAKRSKELIGD